MKMKLTLFPIKFMLCILFLLAQMIRSSDFSISAHTLLEIKEVPFNKILQLLNLEDIARLSKTCKILNQKYFKQSKKCQLLQHEIKSILWIDPTLQRQSMKDIWMPNFITFALKFQSFRLLRYENGHVSLEKEMNPNTFEIFDLKKLTQDAMEKVKEEEKPKWLKTILNDFQLKDFISFYYVPYHEDSCAFFLLFKQVAFKIENDDTLAPFLFLSDKIQYAVMPGKKVLYSKTDKIFKKFFGTKAFRFSGINVDDYFDGYKFHLHPEIETQYLSEDETLAILEKYKTEKAFFLYSN